MFSNNKKSSKNRFLPDIEEYLESIDNNIPVSLQGLELLVDRVTAQTPLTREQAEVITRLFFQEIRHALLRNQIIMLRRLGTFFISSPKSGNKKRIFPKFKPSKILVKELNHDR